MGILDIFRGKGGSSPLGKHADRVANKRAQAPDRWESIHALAQMQTPEAIDALLQRFTFYVDPSITDQEEKDAAFEGVLNAGEVAVEPVVRFLQRSESIGWPLKMLERLLPPEEVIGKLLEALGRMDVEYERDPQRKIQILATLEERKDPRIVEGVQRFLEDANETARFHAVGALVSQGEAEQGRDALLACFGSEESVRIRVRILEAFIERSWVVPEPAAVRDKLPGGYTVDAKGHPRKA